MAPTFQHNQVQPSLGWPLVEMGLQRGNAPLILRGFAEDYERLKRLDQGSAPFLGALLLQMPQDAIDCFD
uniref:hypothetical protein n=1 Tax=Synechococcus sp. CS-1329 TaxID=2847975 RepID=UPI00223BD935|nr:hypothetical protein [Synechococcus sp. CS-1329]